MPESTPQLPFAMQLVSNPKVTVADKIGESGILIGAQAMMKAGAQSEFVAANILQALALKCCIILRAGDPPQYNKHRTPKSGVNLTKTSKQGFFKGSLSQELRFARLEGNGEPRPHDEKDAAHLALAPFDEDYQHTMQLDINMQDILREVGEEGDLQVLGYDEETGFLRFAYKEGRGPKPESFNGQFVINVKTGDDTPLFYSREWDKPDPERDKENWDKERGILKKPLGLEKLPDHVYQRIYYQTFKVHYTEDQNPKPDAANLKSANVFANRARSAEEFKEAMGADHPHYHLIKDYHTLQAILTRLDNVEEAVLPKEAAKQIILDAYNKGGSLIAGDWDGMALAHPPRLATKYKEIIDVFAEGQQGTRNKLKLMKSTNDYLKELKNQAQEKGPPFSAFEEKILSLSSIKEIVTSFALARAGCITPHEFLYQQVLNSVYRDKLNKHYGEKYDMQVVQTAMNKLVSQQNGLSPKDTIALAKKLITEELTQNQEKMQPAILNKIAEHMVAHLPLATKFPDIPYMLPHLQHDMNVHDLFQHGFDMRNPYGSNLEGAWFLITADGSPIYGDTQEQLIEVLLTGDFLKENPIEVGHGADMAAGWGRVIEKQLELNQVIPLQTMEKYQTFRHAQQVEEQAQASAANGVKTRLILIKAKGSALEKSPSALEEAAEEHLLLTI